MARLAFMGTPDFAVPSLDALVAAGHEVAAVYTQPPRPAGRGRRLTPSPVQARAEALGLAVRHPTSLKDPAVQAEFAALGLEAAAVAAYGLILPRAVLAAAGRGCVNVHASLLPRWRGAAPIERALFAGDAETGVTIMVMEAGLDTGPMLATAHVPIGAGTTAPALRRQLAVEGATLLATTLEEWLAGRILGVPQPAEGVTYAAKLTPEDGRIDWRDAAYAERQVRAVPAWFALAAERLKVLAAEHVPEARGAAGLVLDDRLTVACAENGALRPTLVQRPGKAAMAAADLLRGFPIPAGTQL